PLISLRPGVEQEQYWIDYAFPQLQNYDTAKYTPDQWREQLVKVADTASELVDLSPSNGVPPDLLATGLAIKMYPRAKQQMIPAGRTATEVEQLPVAQVVLCSMITDYRRLRDDSFKWYYLPYWLRHSGPDQSAEALHDAEQRFEGYPFINLLGAV